MSTVQVRGRGHGGGRVLGGKGGPCGSWKGLRRGYILTTMPQKLVFDKKLPLLPTSYHFGRFFFLAKNDIWLPRRNYNCHLHRHWLCRFWLWCRWAWTRQRWTAQKRKMIIERSRKRRRHSQIIQKIMLQSYSWESSQRRSNMINKDWPPS